MKNLLTRRSIRRYSDRLSTDSFIHHETYRDYTPESIDAFYLYWYRFLTPKRSDNFLLLPINPNRSDNYK